MNLFSKQKKELQEDGKKCLKLTDMFIKCENSVDVLNDVHAENGAKKKNVQPTVVKLVFELISLFLSTLTLNDLQVELKDFRSKWKNLNKSIQTHYSELTNEIKDNSDSICINCCKIIVHYNLFSGAYPGLF
ncbi:hypothetical protein QTP88_024135 [Uroleucon formosanum]